MGQSIQGGGVYIAGLGVIKCIVILFLPIFGPDDSQCVRPQVSFAIICCSALLPMSCLQLHQAGAGAGAPTEVERIS